MVKRFDHQVNEYIALAAIRADNYDLAKDIWRQTTLQLRQSPKLLGAAREKNVNYSSRRAEKALVDLERVLTGAGIEMFLVSGTLLGCVRENRLLGHDKDIDVGIWDDVTPERLLGTIRPSGLFMVMASRAPEIVRLRHANGIAIDVFYHYREAEDYWHGGVKLRWHNSPFTLARREFLGTEFWIPEDYDRYLTENYGDWRTPKIAFDSAYDTPNGEVLDREELTIHSFKMLTEQMIKGDADKSNFYLDKLQELGEASFASRYGSASPGDDGNAA